MLILVIGDFHIPYRSPCIPDKFRKLLMPGKIQHILCTGNLCTSTTLEFLKNICPHVHVVLGDFDSDKSFPEQLIVKVDDYQFGICHGHQIIPWNDENALPMFQRQLDVDILVTGHTHEFKAFQMHNKLYLNPGSATGAFSPLNPSPIASFVLLDVHSDQINLYVYKLIDGEVKVEKLQYKKSVPVSVSP